MKGTRLPEDWQLPKEWRDWAVAQRPDLNPDEIAACFRDYWIAKTGQGATKLSWAATWRNWVRRQKRYQEPAVKPQSHVIQKQERVSRQQWRESKEIGRRHIAGLRMVLKGRT